MDNFDSFKGPFVNKMQNVEDQYCNTDREKLANEKGTGANNGANNRTTLVYLLYMFKGELTVRYVSAAQCPLAA